MSEAVRSYFRNYAIFSGRTSRRDYWLVQLFLFLVSLVLAVLSLLLIFPILLFGIWIFGNIIPSYSIFVRRMHDRNLSGWVTLWIFIPTLGSLITLVLSLLPGTPGINHYGPPNETRENTSAASSFDDDQTDPDDDRLNSPYYYEKETVSEDDWADF